MYAMALLQGMVFYAPVATLYRQAQGLSVFDITLIESISFIVMILLEIPWGYAADKIGYKKVMIINCGIYFVSKLVFFGANSFGWFLVERVLLGIVCAGLSGVDTGLLYLSAKGGNPRKVFGIYNALSQGGLLMAAGVFALILKDSYRLSALLTAVSYLLAAVLSLFLVEVKGKAETSGIRESFAALKSTVANRKLLLIVIAAALLSEVHGTLTVFLNQPKYVSAGLSPGVISLAYIIVTLGGLCSAVTHIFARKMGDKAFGALLFFLCLAACVGLGFTENGLLCVVLMLILSICHSMFVPLHTAIRNSEADGKNRATVLSMNSSLMSMLAVFANLIFGKIADINLNTAFLFGGVLCAVGGAMYILSFSVRKK